MSAIEHVADTAFWVATYRADEGKRPDALFDDPLASKLVEGRGRAIAASMSSAELTAWLIALRTVIIDDYVNAAVAEGYDLVLNLGAGLDTRPYRMALPSSLRWVEVDFAATIDFKNERLAGETPRCQLERLAVDLGDASARRKLLDDIDARCDKALVITEGVIPYLRNEEAATLAADLHARPHLVGWVLEYTARQSRFGRDFVLRRRRQQLAKAPMRFRVDDWHGFFGQRGWAADEIRYVALEARRLHRPPPLGRWWRLALALLPEFVREKIQRGFGYARMSKR